MRNRIILSIIMFIYFALGTLHIFSVPIGAAPDESAHLIYIKYLQEHKRLPIFQSSIGNYEAHQPPLYYLACLPLYSLLKGLGDNAAALILRLFALFLGAIVILLAYEAIKEIYPESPLIYLSVSAFIAFSPVNIAVCSAVSNDIGAAFVCTLTIYILFKNLRLEFGVKQAIVLGILLSLGLLTKVVSILLIPLAILALFLSCSRKQRPKVEILKLTTIMISVALLISSWWLIRNWRLYGDLFAWGKFQQVFADRPHPEDFYASGFSPFQYLWLVFSLTFTGFFGFVDLARLKISTLNVFYNPGILTPAIFYFLWSFLSLWALLGFFWLLWRLRQKEMELSIWQKYGIIISVVAVFLILCSHLQFNVIFFQAQARYLSPMILPISLLFILGIYQLRPAKLKGIGILFSLLLLLFAAVISLILSVRPYYGFWGE